MKYVQHSSLYVLIYIGQPDEIDLSEIDFFTNVIDRHNNHKSILAIKEHHKDVQGFAFKPVKVEYVGNL